METINAAIVKDGVVQTVIVLESLDDWPVEEGTELIEVTEETGPAGPRSTWDGTHFGPDPSIPPLA